MSSEPCGGYRIAGMSAPGAIHYISLKTKTKTLGYSEPSWYTQAHKYLKDSDGDIGDPSISPNRKYI